MTLTDHDLILKVFKYCPKIILSIVWNDIRLCNRLVTLANLLFLAVALLAKFFFPSTTSALIEPNVRESCWEIDYLTYRVKFFYSLPVSACIENVIANIVNARVIVP